MLLYRESVWAIDATGTTYRGGVSPIGGHLCLVPKGAARERLAEDYAAMVRDGLLLDDADPFDTVMEHCQAIQERANASVAL